MFGFGKKKAVTTQVLSPATGEVVALTEVADAVFSGGSMGEGFGLEPTEGEIIAPVAGKITMVAETKHAFGIETANGLEVLVHLGIDTVELKGKPFEMNVARGQKVRAGQAVAKMDLAQINQAGFKTTIIVVVTNSADTVADFEVDEGHSGTAGEVVGTIRLKKEG
ncbi:PTS glucose transporter subunit IIA [Liquorilactobacillus satsumensis]|uniref:PTS sugar transporter subunit IIA n=1 Tax=Liquorilactobacillus satsumensis TaxID=259059 RepID=UPI002A1225ED|nr:PTS glucose transporter subunit IIABC [Liquorilactobacillus satsumensis]MCP9313024.1 PTS glucose transporter subunit IIA [Liquorilactobacillus satsumensis]MCP9328970.1 PTS glucose transporter subunit IIA [Liquorilactobacillus satsumensis]MCP9357679.1 PTS glucose transporter subunit IIA [Liquorilactobacillus satsumensis]MCP9360180.1 PTS glucose transporter subunit IIA [Liquorilactobacillus satsumensis]